jgi:lambda repressor-like predicted transcriptional regulator
MHPRLKRHEQVKMQLRLAGSSLADVARELGVTSTTVTSVSQGLKRSRRVEALIAEKLQTTPQHLWPERYPVNDGRAPSRTRRPMMT